MQRLFTARKAVPATLIVGIVAMALGIAGVIWLNGSADQPSCPAPATVEQQLGGPQ